MARLTTKQLRNSSSIGSPGGNVLSSVTMAKLKQTNLRIATWNVKTLNAAGKTDNAIKEMKRLHIDILGISEMRWLDAGELNLDEYKVLYSGRTDGKHEDGVGVIMTKKLAASIKTFAPISERILLIQLEGSPVNINIIQVYAPTLDKPDELVEELYNTINNVMNKLKRNEINIVMGDFNSKVGEGKTSDAVGPFGLGERNKRGDTLELFATTHDLILANTWFKQPKRRLYTWKSPSDKPEKVIRNQIDFIMINKRFRNSCTAMRTYPGADIVSDHNPVVGEFKIRMKKIQKKTPPSFDLRKLKDRETESKVIQTLNNQYEATERKDVETEMNTFQKIVQELKKNLLKPDGKKKKSWMTEEILELMEERRMAQGNKREYNRIHKIIRIRIRKAKEKEMIEQCEEIEYLQSKHDDFNIYKKVRELTGNNRKKTDRVLLSEQGTVILSLEEKKEHWTKYIERLFHDTRTEVIPVEAGEGGPDILEEEVTAAIEQLKSRKAPGPDGIHAEFLKLLGTENIKRITSIFNEIYTSGRIPETWLKSEFITLPKKPSAKTCDDYRTISLMSHVLKLFLKIIHRRIYKLCEEQIAPNQFGFLNAVGTREALFSVQVLIQRSRDVNSNVFACLIDYKKAFDRVKHEMMVEIMKQIGTDARTINIITNLYWNQTAVLKIDGEHTEDIQIQRGVRQGCILSPILFNLYSEFIFREALENIDEGIPLNGVRVNNIRYADDAIVFADTQEGLQALMDKVVEVSKRYGLEMNVNKTKLLVVSKEQINNAHIKINNVRIERVKQYTYLGTIINENWDNTQEIKCRIEKARAIFNKMSALFKNHNLTLATKIRFLRCYVFSVLLYGVETWTVSQEMTKRLEAFELWLYRRMLRISWKDKITNIEVLRRMNKETEIIKTVKSRKLQYLGHIMRNEKRYILLQQILQGKINSKRGPGRRRTSWLANLRQWYDKSSAELFRIATNKIKIALMVANIRNG